MEAAQTQYRATQAPALRVTCVRVTCVRVCVLYACALNCVDDSVAYCYLMICFCASLIRKLSQAHSAAMALMGRVETLVRARPHEP